MRGRRLIGGIILIAAVSPTPSALLAYSDGIRPKFESGDERQ
jgi:hypothetical protein